MPKLPPIGSDVTDLIGNVDLYSQPKVKNPDGSISTVDSRSFNIDGKETLLPSVTPDGRHLQTDAEILAEYKKTGRHLGKFSDVASANAAARQLHEDYAAGKYDRTSGLPPIGSDVTNLIQFPSQSKPEPKIGANPNPLLEVDAHGNRITHNPDGSVKFIQGPGFSGNADTSPDRNVADIGGFGVAPEDALMAPGLVRGAGRIAGRIAGAIPKPTLGGVVRAAKVGGSLMMGNPGPLVNEAKQAIAKAVLGEIEKRGAKVAPEVAAKVSERVLPVAAEAVAQKAVFNPTKALQAAKDAFSAIGETPLRGEASNAMEFIRRGVPPEQAVAQVLKNRPAVVDPAELFNAKFGTLTDAQRDAALDLRHARGELKTPSAQTAAQRYPR